MVAVFVVSLEAPVALTAVIILELAEVESTTIEEVCVEGVVMTPELFVSERVALIDSLRELSVEMPNEIYHRQRFSGFDYARRAMNEYGGIVPVGTVLGTAVGGMMALAT